MVSKKIVTIHRLLTTDVKEVVIFVVFVKVKDDESIEEALRRFKHECERNGILKEIKRREFYVPPSIKRKIKSQELKRKLKRARR